MTVDIREAALYGAFIAAGMDLSGELLEHWGQGCLEIVDEAVAVVPIINVLLSATGPIEFPGIYEYEVLEFYGKWFCERVMASKNGEAPTLIERENFICAETAKFFSQCNESEMVRLYSNLCTVTSKYQHDRI